MTQLSTTHQVNTKLSAAIDSEAVKDLDAALESADQQEGFNGAESKFYVKAKLVRNRIVMEEQEEAKVVSSLQEALENKVRSLIRSFANSLIRSSGKDQDQPLNRSTQTF